MCSSIGRSWNLPVAATGLVVLALAIALRPPPALVPA